MTIRHTCVGLVLASGMFSFAGCSAWGPDSRSETQVDASSVEGQTKSLAGLYRDVGSDGSIQPHPQTVGVEGRVNGLVILGGPADVPNMKTGENEIKGSADKTPKMRIGDTTYPSDSDRRNSPGGVAK